MSEEEEDDDTSDDPLGKTFWIYPYHVQFLENINNNTSLALRTLLDSIINGREQERKKQQRDGVINFVSFGLLFFFFSYLMPDIFSTALCVMLGVFLFGYGIIGGVINALQRTRYK